MTSDGMSLSGQRVLVIGGAGFIGAALSRALLAEGVAEVVVYDNFARGKLENIADCLRDPRCRVFEAGGDIRDVDVLDAAVKGKDLVFHLGAMWLLHCKDFPRTAFHVNIEGTFNVLEACVRHGVKRLVYSSSASVYGDAEEIPMTEEHPFRNRNFYGATKIAGEAMCTAFHDRYGLSVIGLRYMNVFGPRQDQHAAYSGVIPVMLNTIAAGEPPTINGDGTQAYDFIHVDDVARCNVLAAVATPEHGFYNVGTEVQTTVRQLCELILRLKRSSLEVVYRPYAADDARQLVKNRIGSRRKAEEELGFRAALSLEDGLRSLIAWRIATGIDREDGPGGARPR